MTSTTIRSVLAWEALDSRGNPTVACAVTTSDGSTASAIVPSGASTGGYEAFERRDGGDRYGGKGVQDAVSNVHNVLASAVSGMDAADQPSVDTRLRETDGTPNLAKLGGNAVLAVSLATLRVHAVATGREVWQVLADSTGIPATLPLPMVNILSGGAHASRCMDIQDVLAVPVGASDVVTAIEWMWRVRRATEELAVASGSSFGLVADEGGIAPRVRRNADAIALVHRGIERAGLRPGDDVAIAIDVAANQFSDGENYRLSLEDRTLTSAEVLAELASWASDHPLVSIEDALSEDDWAGWATTSRALAGIQRLGDDLIATQPDRLDKAAQHGVNAVLVKVNQAGTVSTAAEVVRRAKEFGMSTVVSARSGDTEDSWLTDLSVGWAAGQLKVGSTQRSERTAKWNRLLELAARYDLPYVGKDALAR